ncbi:hypothetical protein SAMN02745216_02983 [Desulfatibacillum alkenivorans DSM 16219]|uniref:Uncharacterized protein n=1 Tax=Desulfatibacillum alkenivorans DSM 16219 TaxID=1121393 RepID=A0A1M6Q6Z8_9BACT|nr:hypothetical protein [Desulfatibacillum alkenivorans]SHK16074.1 hypothetical protein SAMN02745216_02983 [Desulfatibacillum alkenivorans DSM 16219]
MATIVNTKAELKAALKRKDKEIFIEDETLAKHVTNFKKIRKLTKWGLAAMMATAGTGTALIALSPATGGASAVAGTAVYQLAPLIIITEGGAVVSISVALAITALLTLGTVLLFALWKEYNMEAMVKGVGVKLYRK